MDDRKILKLNVAKEIKAHTEGPSLQDTHNQYKQESFTQSLSAVLKQTMHNIVIQHPHYPIQFSINKHVSAEIAYQISTGLYEEDLLASIQKHIHKGCNIVEIGGGLGVSTLLAAKQSNGEIITIEPIEEHQEVIRDNFKINNVKGVIIPGIISKDGSNTFNITRNKVISSIHTHNLSMLDKMVKVKNLDLQEIQDTYKPNTYIVNANGAEKSFTEQCNFDGVSTVIICTHPQITGSNDTVHILNNLQNLGFKILDIHGTVYTFGK